MLKIANHALSDKHYTNMAVSDAIHVLYSMNLINIASNISHIVQLQSVQGLDFNLALNDNNKSQYIHCIE